MSGIGGMSFGMVTTPSLGMAQAKSDDDNKPAGNAAVDEFLAYMKKTLAERMADAWLAAHGLDRAKLKAMKPEQREAVLKQMAEELKQQLQQASADAQSNSAPGRKTEKTEAA
jgi:acyl-CoA reductase-like NAD-dependent aldehyde dehydrogenase